MSMLAPGFDAPPRVLIVDDDSRDRQLMRVMLDTEGYLLETAADGEEALRIVRTNAPDLILLDVLMPGTDGYEVARRIKAQAASRNIPVILITALDDRDARLRGLEAGAEDILSKPIDSVEIRIKVRNLLRLKAAYEEVTRTNAELATALELARDAKREADEANAEKTHFLRVMGHEVRTPLNAIAGYAELLDLGIRGELNADQRHDVSRIRTAAAYLTGLIRDVLGEAKEETSQLVDLAPCDVRQLLDEVTGLCRLQAGDAGLTLSVVEPPDAVFVMANAKRFQQIMLNLVTNAIKFTPRRGKVNVTCERDNGAVRVRVSDTGIGIAADDQARVFDPFVQVGKTRQSGSEPGIGLGLSISREFARAMSGDITLESSAGKGSVFTLTLPAASAVPALVR